MMVTGSDAPGGLAAKPGAAAPEPSGNVQSGADVSGGGERGGGGRDRLDGEVMVRRRGAGGGGSTEDTDDERERGTVVGSARGDAGAGMPLAAGADADDGARGPGSSTGEAATREVDEVAGEMISRGGAGCRLGRDGTKGGASRRSFVGPRWGTVKPPNEALEDGDVEKLLVADGGCGGNGGCGSARVASR